MRIEIKIFASTTTRIAILILVAFLQSCKSDNDPKDYFSSVKRIQQQQQMVPFNIEKPKIATSFTSPWIFVANNIPLKSMYQKSSKEMTEEEFLKENDSFLFLDLGIMPNPEGWKIQPSRTIADQVKGVFESEAAFTDLSTKACLITSSNDTLRPFMISPVNEGGMKNRLYYQLGFHKSFDVTKGFRLDIKGLPTDSSSTQIQF